MHHRKRRRSGDIASPEGRLEAADADAVTLSSVSDISCCFWHPEGRRTPPRRQRLFTCAQLVVDHYNGVCTYVSLNTHRRRRCFLVRVHSIIYIYRYINLQTFIDGFLKRMCYYHLYNYYFFKNNLN